MVGISDKQEELACQIVLEGEGRGEKRREKKFKINQLYFVAEEDSKRG